MRKVATVILCFMSLVLAAQQDLMMTQFAYNKQFYNPSFAGFNKKFTATFLLRDQWMGLEGAPKTQNISFEFPIKNKNLALGLNIVNESIGIQKRLNIQSNYKYAVKLENAVLNLGIGLSFRNFQNDFTDQRLNPIDGFNVDPSISPQKYSANLFNVGAGAVYEKDKFYLGLSAPRLMKNRLSDIEENMFSKEESHWYMILGNFFKLSHLWDFNPEILVKYQSAAPLDIDLHGEFLYNENLMLGFNYRTGGAGNSGGESLAFIAGFQFEKSLLVGAAYDLGISEFRNTHSGSIELFVRYRKSDGSSFEKIVNPRHF